MQTTWRRLGYPLPGSGLTTCGAARQAFWPRPLLHLLFGQKGHLARLKAFFHKVLR